jgi:hypothetical protein
MAGTTTTTTIESRNPDQTNIGALVVHQGTRVSTTSSKWKLCLVGLLTIFSLVIFFTKKHVILCKSNHATDPPARMESAVSGKYV